MLLQLKEQIENDTKKYDELRKEIEEEMWDENIDAEYNGKKFHIIKIRRLSFNLKPGLNQEEILERFPLAVKTSIDLDVLKATAEAHDLFEPKESTYLAVKPIKETNPDMPDVY